MASTGETAPASAVGDTSEALSKFELGVSLILHAWQALSLAVSEQWGGPESADKRDWFAGAVAGLFTAQPLTDVEDVEDMLLQVMEDEFGVVIEDGSEIPVAKEVLRIREECGRGEYGTVDALFERWKRKKGTNAAPQIARAGPDSADEESVDDEDWDEDADVLMTDAPSRESVKDKPKPEVDEDGFTKVVGKKRR